MGALGPGGILLVDKPAGLTSFQVVERVRRQLLNAFPDLQPRRGPRPAGTPKPPRFKCGHAGTLDPLATGLLVVMVGKGSRLSPYLMGLDKTYAATVRFGWATTTLDREGEVTDTAPVPAGAESVVNLLPQFLGEQLQVPPLISALKRDGKALYKRVRAGEDVAEPEARPVTISRLEMTAVRWPGQAESGPVHEIDLVVDCGSGTYIRSLARDLARAAGSAGHIQELRRLRVGPFGVEDALPGVMELDGAALAAALKPLAEALPGVPALELDAVEVQQVRQGGQPLPPWLKRLDHAPVDHGKHGRLFRMLDRQGQLVAVGLVDAETGLPRSAVVIPETGD